MQEHEIEPMIDAYRVREPQRRRDPFSDRAFQRQIAALAAERGARGYGLRGLLARWVSTVPRATLVTGTLSVALLLGGVGGGALSWVASDSDAAKVGAPGTLLATIPPKPASLPSAASAGGALDADGATSDALAGDASRVGLSPTLLTVAGAIGLGGSLAVAVRAYRRRR